MFRFSYDPNRLLPPPLAQRMINRFLRMTRDIRRFSNGRGQESEIVCIRPVLILGTGVRISVQASESHYCWPRNNYGPYTEVEVAVIHQPENAPKVQDRLDKWAEAYDDELGPPALIVCGYVPIEVIDDLILEHGGFIEISKSIDGRER